MRRTSLLCALAAIAAPLPSAVGLAPADAAVPAGFSDSIVASVPGPTSIAWTPDGRMLITQDNGRLRVVRGGAMNATPAVDVGPRACTGGERGLSGMTVDPAFQTNRYVYLYWTHNAHGFCGEGTPDTPENRVARYVLGDDDRVVPGSEQVIVDHMPSPATNHNGGDLHFGADGLLYISVGDGGCTIGDPTRCGALNTNSRRLDIPNGKILRVTGNGAVPASNPYAGAAGGRRCTAPAGVPAGTGPCTETFASGFRNPFRFAQRPGTSEFLVNDVGQSTWEEIDALLPGRDYGWNVREGHCATGSTTACGPTSFENPVFDYSHTDGCASITGGAFVPTGLWPAPYSGSYLFADYVCGGIFRLVPQAGGGYTRAPFLTGSTRPVHLAFGPSGTSQALYYLDYAGGTVHRISATVANTPPVAKFFQRPNGLTVTLNGRGSYDPDSEDSVRSWSWDFGDGTSATTTTPSTTHTYPRAEPFLTTLRVTDSRGAVSAPVSKQVYAGEHPPQVTLTAPPTTARFSVGEGVTMTASATDAEDGALPPSSLTWTVLTYHGTHTHPFLGPVSGSPIGLTFPAPEDLAATTTSYLQVTVVARDSRGLTSKVVRRLQPRQVSLSFATSPAGGRVVVNGVSRATPSTLVSWAGWVLHVEAPDQLIGGVPYTFASWSDGGARRHDITTPTQARSYTATFTRSP